MKKLFLAAGTIRDQSYMAESVEYKETRLVWANTEKEAKKIFEDHFTKRDPYGRGIWVFGVDAYETLGSPYPLT